MLLFAYFSLCFYLFQIREVTLDKEQDWLKDGSSIELITRW